MSDVKISQLPAAGSLTGSEIVPIVQSNATVRTTISEIFSSLAPSSALATPGYQEFPSGLIIQWGRNTTTSGNGDVITFPKAYTTACFFVIADEANASGWGSSPSPSIYGVGNFTPTTFQVYGVTVNNSTGQSSYTSGISFNWFSMGV